jgi:glycine cleavage system H protein
MFAKGAWRRKLLCLASLSAVLLVSSCTAAATLATTNTGSTAPDSTEITVYFPSPAGTVASELIFRTDRLYTNTHLWVKQESEDTVRIGITYYGQLGLGACEDVGMPENGAALVRGDSFDCYFVGDDCMIFDFASPVTGHIMAVNPDVEFNRSIIHASPYDDAWLVVAHMDDPEELETLLTYNAYLSSSCPPCHCNH